MLLLYQVHDLLHMHHIFPHEHEIPCSQELTLHNHLNDLLVHCPLEQPCKRQIVHHLIQYLLSAGLNLAYPLDNDNSLELATFLKLNGVVLWGEVHLENDCELLKLFLLQ